MVVENTSEKVNSTYLQELGELLKSDETPCKLSLLDRLNVVCAQPPSNIEDAATFEAQVLDGMLDGKGRVLSQHKVAVRLGMLIQKSRAEALVAGSPNEKIKPGMRRPSIGGALLLGGDHPPARPPGGESKKASFGASPAKGGAKAVEVVDRFEGLGISEKAWLKIVGRTDEIYVAHEAAQELFKKLMIKFVTEAARDDDEAEAMVKETMYGALKDPVRLHEKAMDDQYAERFTDGGLAEACISDVSRCRVSMPASVTSISTSDRGQVIRVLRAPILLLSASTTRRSACRASTADFVFASSSAFKLIVCLIARKNPGWINNKTGTYSATTSAASGGSYRRPRALSSEGQKTLSNEGSAVL
mgnify:CR=1 FL=1